MFGRKPALFFTILMFLLGSALCGAAKSFTWLCIARGVQGIGGGGALQVRSTLCVKVDVLTLPS